MTVAERLLIVGVWLAKLFAMLTIFVDVPANAPDDWRSHGTDSTNGSMRARVTKRQPTVRDGSPPSPVLTVAPTDQSTLLKFPNVALISEALTPGTVNPDEAP